MLLRLKPGANASSSKKATRPLSQNQPVWRFNEIEHQAWHPDEKLHRRWERRYWLASIVLTVGIALGAGFSARYAYRAALEAHEQAAQARRQADYAGEQLIYSSRAWVDLDIEINGPITYIANGDLRFPVKLKLKNVGQSPATNVAIFAQWFLRVVDKSIPDALESTCTKAGLYTIITKGNYAVFPGKEIDPDWNFGYPNEKLQESNRKLSSSLGIPIVSLRFTESPQLLACVTYNIVGDNKIHFTRVVRNLHKLVNGEITPQLNFPNTGTVPTGEIRMDSYNVRGGDSAD